MENNQIIYYKQLDSTNTKLQKLAEDGAGHGTVVVAQKQTAGKGRRGRNWESDAEGNIYMSLLLRPDIETAKASMLTLVTAYSVAKVIQKYGFENVQIKWPNDLVLSGKKICGILTEMKLKGTEIDFVVVGIGVNVNAEAFSEELSDKATSLYLECGEKINPEHFIQDILHGFWEAYEHFIEKTDLSFMQEEYNAMLVNCNKEVKVLEPGNEYTAVALGINENGELLVENDKGETKTVFAGEVSVRGVYGYV